MSVELKRSSREGQETGDADHKLLANSPTNQTTTNNWPTHQPTKQPQRTGQLTNEPNNHKEQANSPTNQTTTNNWPTHQPTRQLQRTDQLTIQPNNHKEQANSPTNQTGLCWLFLMMLATCGFPELHRQLFAKPRCIHPPTQLYSVFGVLVTVGWCSVSVVLLR